MFDLIATVLVWLFDKASKLEDAWKKLEKSVERKALTRKQPSR